MPTKKSKNRRYKQAGIYEWVGREEQQDPDHTTQHELFGAFIRQYSTVATLKRTYKKKEVRHLIEQLSIPKK